MKFTEQDLIRRWTEGLRIIMAEAVKPDVSTARLDELDAEAQVLQVKIDMAIREVMQIVKARPR